MLWHYKDKIDEPYTVSACAWVSHKHLAVCMLGCVDVYEVTADGYHLAYQLTPQEWKGRQITGVAVSKALPDSMLVVCNEKPYVYQSPCHEATQHVNKYKIQGEEVNPQGIVANANTAVIRLPFQKRRLVVCSLPDFTHQSHVHISFDPFELSISTDYLLVMGRNEMVVKPLGDMSQDLCRIESPDGEEFMSVCFRNDAGEIYAGCVEVVQGEHGERSRIYKYTWNGSGNPEYTNAGCIIDGLGWVGWRCLSMTSSARGLLAVGEGDRFSPNKVRLYSLE